MTKPKPCPPAPGPLEEYAARFDDLFSHVAQRRGFREYLAGLLQPRSRNKTLTCLADAEPVAGAGSPPAQRLQFFLSESCWDPVRINERRLRLLLADPATAAHAGGVLVIDDSGDRKDGTATAFAGRQWLGRLGKTDNGVVTVTTLWADERLYFPLHAQPYTPARRLPGGKNDPAFRTKWQIAVELAAAAIQAGVGVRAAVADCAYGDLDNFRAELRRIGLAWVMALRPAAAPGPTGPGRIHRERPPGSWAGPGRISPVTGSGSSAPSVMGTPRPGGPGRPGWAPGARTGSPGWWWPPPIRPRCPTRPLGIWPPTCPALDHPARPTVLIRPPTWPNSSASTASGTGSNRATNRSRTSWAGPTSKSAPASPSNVISRWSTAPSVSAGPPGSLIRPHLRCHRPVP